MKLIACMAFVWAILLPAAAGAQGSLQSFRCGEIPPGSALDVQTLQDTPEMLKLGDAVAETLRRDGFGISDDAPLRLIIDRADPLVPRPDRPIGPPNGEGVERGTRGDIEALGDQLDTLRRQESAKRNISRGADDIRITMIVNEKAGGRCLWQGEVRHPRGADEDYWKIAERAAVRLAGSLGKQLDNAPFTLR